MMAREHKVAAVAWLIFIATLGLGWALYALERTGGEPTRVREMTAAAAQREYADLFHAGVQLLGAGRAEEAVEIFGKAVALRPEIAEGHANLGFALLDAGEPLLATHAFAHAIDLKPMQTNAYYGLSSGLEAQGDVEGALGAMRSYLHLAPPDDPFRRKAMSAIWEMESAQEAAAKDIAIPTAPNDRPQRRSTVIDYSRADDMPLIDRVAALMPLGEDWADLPARGQVLVVNLWATWCPPCRTELPVLQALSESLDKDKALVMGISIDKDPDFVREFLRETGVLYGNRLDSDKSVVSTLMQDESYPQTVVVNADGAIVGRVAQSVGPDNDGALEDLKRLIAKATADSTAVAADKP